MTSRVAPAPPPLAEIDDLEVWQRALSAAQSHVERSQAALIQAHKLEAIGQLAAGVAHEINTPVQYVSDNLAFVVDAIAAMEPLVRSWAETAGAPHVAALLDEIPRALADSLDGLGRVASIVSALRSFSHPSRGNREPFDLNETLRTTIALARTEWRHVAEVVADLDPELPPLTGIRDELAQVFLNLIINAAHAITETRDGAPASRGVIGVSTQRHENDILVRVSDNGSGIPAAIRDRIFEPFFTTKPVGRGTGQGLALTHTVVQKHGGSIRFDSELGRGTTFIVTLPIRGASLPP